MRIDYIKPPLTELGVDLLPIVELLDEANKVGREQPLTAVLADIDAGRLWLLVARDDADSVVAAFTCRQVDYHAHSALRVVLGAGEPMDGWLEPLIAKLDEGARTIGASQVECIGRPGFARALKGVGFERYAYMVREVPDEQGRGQDHDGDHQPAAADGLAAGDGHAAEPGSAAAGAGG